MGSFDQICLSIGKVWAVKRIILGFAMLVTLFVLPGTAQAAVYKTGYNAHWITKPSGCFVNVWTSGVYRSQGHYGCPLGERTRVAWHVYGRYNYTYLRYYGPSACAHFIKLKWENGRSYSIWTFGSFYRSCDVRVPWVEFYN